MGIFAIVSWLFLVIALLGSTFSTIRPILGYYWN